MRNFPLQTIFFFNLMCLCNHFFLQKHLLANIFFTVLSSLALKIFKLNLFFEKKKSIVLSNYFGHICSQ